MTDSYTDELFDLGGRADVLRFPVSRLLVDPERFREDFDEPMSERGMGAVYTKTHAGKPLKIGFDRDALLKEYYDPLHQALEDWAAMALKENDTCLIIDCHSFPSEPLPCDLDQSPNRPDFCIGTTAFHTSEGLVNAIKSNLEMVGHSVSIDNPYSGTIVPLLYLSNEPRVQSIMIEVNRHLYMDEKSGKKLAVFQDVQSTVRMALSVAILYQMFPKDPCEPSQPASDAKIKEFLDSL